MNQKLKDGPDVVGEWLDKFRSAPTMAEASFYLRMAKLAAVKPKLADPGIWDVGQLSIGKFLELGESKPADDHQNRLEVARSAPPVH